MTPSSPTSPALRARSPAALINPDHHNFSPRLGFAWRPSQKHSRVIRGGYSIFFSGSPYSPDRRQIGRPNRLCNHRLSQHQSRRSADFARIGFPPAACRNPPTHYAINPNYKLAYAQTWSLRHSADIAFEPRSSSWNTSAPKVPTSDVAIVPNQSPPGASDARTAIAYRQRIQFHLPDYTGNSILPCRPGPRHAALLARHVRRGAVHFLKIHRRRIQLHRRRRRHHGADSQRHQRRARAYRSFDQRHRLSLTYTLSSPVGVHGMWRNGGWKTQGVFAAGP